MASRREIMLKRLASLPHPIVEDVVFFDDGCDFSILTPKKGYRCLLGGNFPIFGPIKISTSGKKILETFANDRGDRAAPSLSKKAKDDVDLLCDILGKDGIKDLVNFNTPRNTYYIFSDIGRGEHSIFGSRAAVCNYFFKYFTEVEEGILWSSMCDRDLAEWDQKRKHWRKEGEKELIPKKYYSVHYNPLTGYIGPIPKISL
jgi:hypothetical protein